MKLLKLFCLVMCFCLTLTTQAAVKQFGPIKANMTLWRIAKQVKPVGVNNQQMMLALIKANPAAFEGNNVNGLKAGMFLRLPRLAEIKTVRPAWAIAEVEQQNAAWQARHQRPRQRSQRVATTAVTKQAATILAVNDEAITQTLQSAIKDQERVTSVVARAASTIASLDQAQQDTTTKLAAVADDVASIKQQNSQFKSDVDQRLNYLSEENKAIQKQLVNLDKEVNNVTLQVVELTHVDNPQVQRRQLSAVSASNVKLDAGQQAQDQQSKNSLWQLILDKHVQFKTQLGVTTYKVAWLIVLAILCALIWWLLPKKKSAPQPKKVVKTPVQRRPLVEPSAAKKKTEMEEEYDYMGSREGIPAKLDLARAYLEMEDLYSARQTLNEVLAEGDSAQKAEAEKLMNALMEK